MSVFMQPRRPRHPDQLWELMTSAKSGNPETIRRKAVEMGWDLNSVNQDGQTLLTKAIKDKVTTSTVEAIIKAGAFVDFPDGQGKTSLMIAVEVKRPDILKVLIQYGADPQLKTTKCISAIALCLKGEHYKYLKILLKQGKNNIYSLCENFEEVCLFLREINELKDKERSEDPRLISAIKNVYDVNIKDMNGNTPLIHAVRCHLDDCVRLLLLAGADVNKINKNKETALTIAMTRSHNPILKDLVRAGALQGHPRDETSTLNFGMFKMILEYLQQNGLFNMADIYGKTALMYAVERGDKASMIFAVKKDIEERVKAKFLLDRINTSTGCVLDGNDADSVSTPCASNETENINSYSREDSLLAMRKYQDNSRPIIMQDFETGQMLDELFVGEASIFDNSEESTVIYANRYCDFLTEEIIKLLVGETHKEQYQDGKTALMMAVIGYNGGSPSI